MVIHIYQSLIIILDNLNRFPLYIDSIPVAVLTLWLRFWRWSVFMVVHIRGSFLSDLQNTRWDGRQTSKKNWEFLTLRTPLWSWLRFIHMCNGDYDDYENDTGWKQFYCPSSIDRYNLSFSFFNSRRILHWWSISRNGQRSYRRINGIDSIVHLLWSRRYRFLLEHCADFIWEWYFQRQIFAFTRTWIIDILSSVCLI